MNRVASIQQALEAAFSPEHLDIIDDSHKHAGHAGVKEHGGGHFVVHIVDKAFNNQSRMQRHRLVNAATKHLFPDVIHALSIHAQTPEEAT